MPDILASYRKHGFPDEKDSESGYVTTIEYVGPEAALKTNKPAAGTVWGDYLGTVSLSHYTPLPRSNAVDELPYGLLIVICQLNYGGEGLVLGTKKETAYEIDWVPVERSMYEHPDFNTGGTFALTDDMRQDIEAWRNEVDTEVRKNFAYWPRDKEGKVNTGVVNVLDANAAYFCEYILRGVESWVDYAPVARRSSTYVGGPPPESEAGQKESLPASFPNKPTGYEWRKSGDRHLRAGGQTRWTRSEEWQGAIKVLVDKDQLFL